jgi:hypothetical protein
MLPSFVDRQRQRADPHTRVVAECGNCDACRHHRSNSPFRPKWASQMGYRAFRGTRMATGIERSRRPNGPFSRPRRRGRLHLYASDFDAPGTGRAFTKVRQRVGKATRQTAAMHPSPWPNGSLWATEASPPRTRAVNGAVGELRTRAARPSPNTRHGILQPGAYSGLTGLREAPSCLPSAQRVARRGFSHAPG